MLSLRAASQLPLGRSPPATLRIGASSAGVRAPVVMRGNLHCTAQQRQLDDQPVLSRRQYLVGSLATVVLAPALPALAAGEESGAVPPQAEHEPQPYKSALPCWVVSRAWPALIFARALSVQN